MSKLSEFNRSSIDRDRWTNDCELSVKSMMAGAAIGDSNAYAEIYDTFAAQIYGEALSELKDPSGAEDVAQAVLLSLFKNAGRFKRDGASSLSWVRVVTRRRCMALNRIAANDGLRRSDVTD
jgi:RNA polymerase sigma-70 factor, ECF subfamily